MSQVELLKFDNAQVELLKFDSHSREFTGKIGGLNADLCMFPPSKSIFFPFQSPRQVDLHAPLACNMFH